ncbi:CopD family protein [Shewanella insulae]|uniref:CopD family protein n=1 Tax=Shewanella insulae TaxID=2681496 RepID=UPI001EFD2E39|nr:CopD family protein [Shewanella insulae]MCG9755709.1 CopD family protein [Shewanella insulae]
MYGLILTLHILAATIWTGGHIVLSVVVLPRVLKEKSPQRLLEFESVYEKIGMPALVIQIITGLMLAYRLLPDVSLWFDMSVPLAHGIAAKLTLLGLTFLLALDARFRVVPKLSPSNLTDMALHIIPVTLFSIMFVLVGISFKLGGLAYLVS